MSSVASTMLLIKKSMLTQLKILMCLVFLGATLIVFWIVSELVEGRAKNYDSE